MAPCRLGRTVDRTTGRRLRGERRQRTLRVKVRGTDLWLAVGRAPSTSSGNVVELSAAFQPSSGFQADRQAQVNVSERSAALQPSRACKPFGKLRDRGLVCRQTEMTPAVKRRRELANRHRHDLRIEPMWSQREVIDYALQRRRTLEGLKRPGKRLAKLDACDADPMLLRAAKYHGEQAKVPCPVCESDRDVQPQLHVRRAARPVLGAHQAAGGAGGDGALVRASSRSSSSRSACAAAGTT